MIDSEMGNQGQNTTIKVSKYDRIWELIVDEVKLFCLKMSLLTFFHHNQYFGMSGKVGKNLTVQSCISILAIILIKVCKEIKT